MAKPQTNKSTSATHLTNLTLDISQLQKQLQTVDKDITNTANKAVANAERIKNAFANINTNNNVVGINNIIHSTSNTNLNKNINQIEKLALAYARLANSMSGQRVTDPALNALISQAKGYEQVLNNLIRNANILGGVTPRMAQQFQQVADALTPLQHQFANLVPQIRQMSQQYRQMEKDINSTISALKKLEKNVVSDKGRREVTRLKNEFQQLANNMRNMTVQDVQTQLENLNSSFEELNRTVPTTTNWVNRFVEAITQRARWMIAYGILNTILSSFSNLGKVIKETEDSVIELQRVLNNPPQQNAIAEELNEIAYEYGQTFANVQEVAIRFAQTGMDWNNTIEATRATMLGLNTAELEVDTATQGLIAVIAQFNIEANDLEQVIDKINITADNFPVTSEKIVAALQRAGGTASAFGLSLEETISVITALSEATGRSGEAIGTAMNSLISFTMKASSLKTFSDFLGFDVSQGYDVLQIWELLGEKIENGNQGLIDMMASSEEFAELFNEEIADALSLQNEYNDAVAHAEDVYSSVGVYRKNYFIALLNNIQTVTDAMDNMALSNNYSVQENETAMQALSKQFNQLVVAARELAVQFGEIGYLDLLKSLTALATSVLKIIKSLGGLQTVLLGIAAALFAVKKPNIVGFIKTVIRLLETGLMLPLTSVRGAIQGITRAQRAWNIAGTMGYNITTRLAVAVNALRASMGNILAVLTMVMAAWSYITGKIKEQEAALEEVRQEYLDTGQTATEELDNMYQAYKKLDEARTSGNQQEIRNAQIALAEVLGYTADDLAILAERAGSLDKALSDLLDTEYRQIAAEIQMGAEASKVDFSKITEEFVVWNEETRKAVSLLENLGINLNTTLMGKEFAPAQSYSEAVETVKKVDEALNSMQRTWTSVELAENDVYKATLKFRSELVNQIEETKNMNDTTTLLADTFGEYVNNVDAIKEAIEALLNGNKNAILSFEELKKRIEALGTEYENISKQVDTFQSSYSTLQDVINEYNQTGLLTADMLQSLLELEPQYLELLDTKNGMLAINDEALGNMINSNDIYMNQLIAIKIAEDAETWALKLKEVAAEDMTEAEINAALASVTLSSDIAKAAYECLSGAGDANTFTNAIKDLGEQAGLSGNALDIFAGKVAGTMQNMSNLRNMFMSDKNALRNKDTNTSRINRYYPTKSVSSSSGGSTKSKQDILKEDLKEKLEIYEHTIFILEKNSSEVNRKVAQATKEALDSYNEEMKLVTEKGIDLSQTVFGNIDTNSRQILEWTDENLKKYQEALVSWGQDLDELRGSFSTLLGSSAEFDGVEIAFSPILQTQNGPVLLNQATVDKYIFGLIEKAGEGWHNEDLFKLDTEGLLVDGQLIKNLIADIGETAIKTGEAMHYVGDLGSVAQAKKYLDEVKANNLTSAEQQINIYKKMQEEIHTLAEKYRNIGMSEDSSYIRELSEKWWSYQDEIVKLMDGIYDATIEAHENALSLLENQYSRLDRYTDYSGMTENLRKQYDIQRKIQEAAHNEAQRLRKMGVSENDEAIQACINAWWDAENAIQEINSKIEESILNTYDDFISMADKFDLWEYMDFTKVDYLHEKLGAVNDMLKDGTISLKEYNNQLKEIGEALYDARVEQFEQQKEEVEKKYEDLIQKQKQRIENLKNEKEILEDYYDTVVKGYEKEIETWEKKKEEVEDYYDKLIKNLQDVEKSNERINKQVDYYNERQKIITNIEQAQARSGVAWREKEMEYQQQLIELDEEWRRTQEEWNIDDQISKLQELKQIAISDIDKTIEKINQFITNTEEQSEIAIGNIDKEIKGIENTIDELELDAEEAIANIDEDIKALSRSIAEAIKNGTADGLVDVSAEFDQASRNAIIALGGTVVEGQNVVDNGIKETAQQGLVSMNNMLFEPMKKSIEDVANTLKQSIISNTEIAAKTSLDTFKQNLIQPLQNDLQKTMKEAQVSQTANTQSKINKTINNSVTSNLSKKKINSDGSITNVFINNKVGSATKGYEKAQSILQKLRF